MGNISFSLTVCVLCLIALTFIVWKENTLFLKESDILAVKQYGTTNWQILWSQDQYFHGYQADDLQVY